MLRLIQAEFASARKPDSGHRPPSRFLHRRTTDALLLEHRDFGLEVVAHEIQFRPIVLLGRMDRHFRRKAARR